MLFKFIFHCLFLWSLVVKLVSRQSIEPLSFLHVNVSSLPNSFFSSVWSTLSMVFTERLRTPRNTETESSSQLLTQLTECSSWFWKNVKSRDQIQNIESNHQHSQERERKNSVQRIASVEKRSDHVYVKSFNQAFTRIRPEDWKESGNKVVAAVYPLWNLKKARKLHPTFSWLAPVSQKRKILWYRFEGIN